MDAPLVHGLHSSEKQRAATDKPPATGLYHRQTVLATMNTLADVLRRLTLLMPDRFKQIAPSIYIVRGGVWRGVCHSETYVDEDRVLGALEEIVSEKSFDVQASLGGVSKRWLVTIHRVEDYQLLGEAIHSRLAIALALALEAALISEQQQKEGQA